MNKINPLCGIFSLLFLFFNVSQATAQKTFQMKYGGKGFEEARCMIKLSKGGFLLGGRAASLSGNTDMHILKVDNNGSLIWEQKLGEKETEEAFGLLEAKDGNYVVAGSSDSFSDSPDIKDMWLVKISAANGNVIWAKTYGSAESIDEARAVAMGHDGGYLVLGHSFSLNGDQTGDLLVVKTDDSGNEVWRKNFGGPSNEQSVAVMKNDEGYILLANTESFGKGKWDIWMVQIDKEGNKLWEQSYGGGDNEMANSFIKTKDGFMIVGYTYSFAMASLDFWVVKTDLKGQMQWHKVFGGMSTDEAFGIIEASDGNFVVGGYTEVWKGNQYGENTSKDGHNILLVKIDGTGKKIWERSIGGEHDQRAFAISESSDRGLVLVGFHNSDDNNGTDVLIMKVSESGTP